jgi:hypothetical protein
MKDATSFGVVGVVVVISLCFGQVWDRSSLFGLTW